MMGGASEARPSSSAPAHWTRVWCAPLSECGAVRIRLDDICSLTDFHRHTKRHVDRLARTKRPVVLTVNGRARLVVQEAAAYESLLKRLERNDQASRG